MYFVPGNCSKHFTRTCPNSIPALLMRKLRCKEAEQFTQSWRAVKCGHRILTQTFQPQSPLSESAPQDCVCQGRQDEGDPNPMWVVREDFLEEETWMVRLWGWAGTYQVGEISPQSRNHTYKGLGSKENWRNWQKVIAAGLRSRGRSLSDEVEEGGTHQHKGPESILRSLDLILKQFKTMVGQYALSPWNKTISRPTRLTMRRKEEPQSFRTNLSYPHQSPEIL